MGNVDVFLKSLLHFDKDNIPGKVYSNKIFCFEQIGTIFTFLLAVRCSCLCGSCGTRLHFQPQLLP